MYRHPNASYNMIKNSANGQWPPFPWVWPRLRITDGTNRKAWGLETVRKPVSRSSHSLHFPSFPPLQDARQSSPLLLLSLHQGTIGIKQLGQAGEWRTRVFCLVRFSGSLMCNAAVTLLKLHVYMHLLGFSYSAHSGLGGLNGTEILRSNKLPGDVHQLLDADHTVSKKGLECVGWKKVD